MLRSRLLIPLLALLIVAATILSPAAGATTLVWNLGDDFAVSPNQANPNPDQYGNPGVWSFLQGRAEDTSSYTLLPGFVSDAFDVEGLEQWQWTFDPGDPNAKLPAVGINATGIDQHPTTFTWPAGAIRVHPLLKRSVVVGWQSPIDAGVKIEGQLDDLDATGGNGIRWACLLKDGSFEEVLIGGVNPNGYGTAFIVPLATVSKGTLLYFIVGSYQGDDMYDSTELDLTITQVQD
jgi:hypothetical protein